MCPSIRSLSIIAASALGILVNGCGGGGGGGGAAVNVRPDFIMGTISMVSYNGTTDDLATAGLGKTGLAGASPTAADPRCDDQLVGRVAVNDDPFFAVEHPAGSVADRARLDVV